jgi:hypothetical protein
VQPRTVPASIEMSLLRMTGMVSWSCGSHVPGSGFPMAMTTLSRQKRAKPVDPHSARIFRFENRDARLFGRESLLMVWGISRPV